MGLIDNTILNTALVKIDTEYNDAEGALNDTANVLFESGVVKDTFKEAIIKREKEFPTGLNFGGIGIAIPHTDAEHVIKQSIAMNRLKKPVKFVEMASDNNLVDVSLIVMLAIKDPKNQIQFLQALMEVFQNKDNVEKMIDSKSKEKLIGIFKKEINEVVL